MQETWIWSSSQEDPQEKKRATHSSTFAWKIHGQKNWAGYSPWNCKELDTTVWLTFTFICLSILTILIISIHEQKVSFFKVFNWRIIIWQSCTGYVYTYGWFTLLCSYPHHPSPELSHFPKLKLCAHETLTPHPPASDLHHPTFCPMVLSPLSKSSPHKNMFICIFS